MKKLPGSLWLLLGGLLLVAGCGGTGGLGAGTATLKFKVSELAGTGFLSKSTRSLTFDETSVGGGEPVLGATVRVVKQGGDLDVEAITDNSGQGQVVIGGLPAGTYLLTLTGSSPSEAISFPVIVEGPAILVIRGRLERDATGPLLNVEAITDNNGDNISDDGFKETILGQRPTGGGTIIIHHSHGSNAPPQEANLQVTGTLNADGTYNVTGEIIVPVDP